MKTRLILFFVLFITLYLFSGAAFSATYYLSPTGNDNNGCTNSTNDACFSPARARKSQIGISNGDTILFKNGTYHYSSGIAFSAGDGGKNGAPITYKADTAGSVVLDFGGSARAWQFNGTEGYIVLDGLTLIDFQWGFVNYDDNITVQHCNFTAAKSWPPSGNAISGAKGGGCLVQFTGNNLVIDNVIADTCTDPTVSDSHGIYIDSGVNGIIRNSIFRNNMGGGLVFQAKGLGYGNFTGWKVYGNRIYSNALSSNKHGAYFRGYGIKGGCAQFHDINFYNNLIYNNSSVGYCIVVTAENGCEADINIFNNTCYKNSNGVTNKTGSGTIENNIIVENSPDITPLTLSNQSVIMRNNLTSSGSEGDGVVGSFSSADFASTNPNDSNFLALKETATAAIDKGLATGINSDFANTPRPQGNGYDIGAFEYVSKALSPLDSIAIEGPVSVTENTITEYHCRAYYTDGSNRLVTAETWNEDSAFATIDSAGKLMAAEVNGSGPCKITATYSENGISRTAVFNLTIEDFAGVVLDNGNAGTTLKPPTVQSVILKP